MFEKFELKLIRIHWKTKNQFGYIEEISNTAIKVSKNAENHFFTEIPSYPRIDNKHVQLAIRCDSSLDHVTPAFKKADDKPYELYLVDDPKYGKWWIEKGEWRKKFEYHDAPTCRHAGLHTIILNDTTIEITITPSGFTLEEYQELLNGFKGQLWQLILNKDSSSTISKGNKGKFPGELFRDYVGKFTQFAEQILLKPNEELREIQEIQRIEKVRPTSKTFMELSTKGSSVKFVTGRGYNASYNTPENKYIADIINRLRLIVGNLKKGMKCSQDNLESQISVLEYNLSEKKTNCIKIDPAKLEKEIKQVGVRIQKWEQRKIEFEKYFAQKNEKSGEHKTKIEFTVNSLPKIDEYNDEYTDYISFWLYHDSPHNSYMLKFPCNSCDIGFFTQNAEYCIKDVWLNKNEIEKDHKTYHIAHINHISSIEIIKCPTKLKLELLQNNWHNYSKKNWERQLTKNEIDNKEKEVISLTARKCMIENHVEQYAKILSSMNFIYQKLSSLHRKCNILNIKNENRLDYPGTMIFIQNPAYSGAYSSFKKIQNETSFSNESFFDNLLVIDKFGITDQPNIYEKWCLLQIINILQDEFCFTQNDGWENNLVSSFSRKKYQSCSFFFTNSALDYELELIYQPTLANGKIPDFMLKIRSNSDTFILILDAKNKQYGILDNIDSSPTNTFSYDLNNLVNKKDYSESGKNAVFIIHPMNEKGFLPILSTPQSWSYWSTFGGSRLFKWEDSSSNHKYGGIQLRPGNLDNLKILIAMSLQYLAEKNLGVYDKQPENKVFCIVCGGTDFDNTTRGKTKGKHYTCNNQDCRHFFVKSYCSGCGNRLWKHDSYWTYHDTLSTQPYNIMCPFCGEFVPQKDSDGEL